MIRLFLAAMMVTCAFSAQASEPFNSNGDVGLTNYTTLPFQGSILQDCGASAGLTPMVEYYSANPSSKYLNSGAMAAVRSCVTNLENSGIVNASGMQRWEETWEIAQPASLFAGEPSYINDIRNNSCDGYPGNSGSTCTGQPEFVAWANWLNAHSQYMDTAWDGGTMPDYYRSWHSKWGHINPATPLADADCSPAPSPCNYGQKKASQWAAAAALSGSYGL